jgi:hypothetical protein
MTVDSSLTFEDLHDEKDFEAAARTIPHPPGTPAISYRPNAFIVRCKEGNMVFATKAPAAKLEWLSALRKCRSAAVRLAVAHGATAQRS